jgi:hypothetical protein
MNIIIIMGILETTIIIIYGIKIIQLLKRVKFELFVINNKFNNIIDMDCKITKPGFNVKTKKTIL